MVEGGGDVTREGFIVRDRHVSTYLDAKVLRAVARLGPSAAVAYDQLLDYSWAQGERATLEDALLGFPVALYGIGDVSAYLAVFVEVGLLDGDGRVPDAAWDRWFGPAAARKAAAREGGVEGARRRWGKGRNGVPNGDPNGVPIRTPNALRPSSDRPPLTGRRTGGRNGQHPATAVDAPDGPERTVRVWSGPERVSAVLGPSDGRGDVPRGEDGEVRRLPRPAFLGGDVTEVLET